MGERIIKAIEWLLLEFEARMVTFMIWLCWVCGITSDDVERARGEKNRVAGAASMTNAAPLPSEPRHSSPTR